MDRHKVYRVASTKKLVKKSNSFFVNRIKLNWSTMLVTKWICERVLCKKKKITQKRNWRNLWLAYPRWHKSHPKFRFLQASFFIYENNRNFEKSLFGLTLNLLCLRLSIISKFLKCMMAVALKNLIRPDVDTLAEP